MPTYDNFALCGETGKNTAVQGPFLLCETAIAKGFSDAVKGANVHATASSAAVDSVFLSQIFVEKVFCGVYFAFAGIAHKAFGRTTMNF